MSEKKPFPRDAALRAHGARSARGKRGDGCSARSSCAESVKVHAAQASITIRMHSGMGEAERFCKEGLSPTSTRLEF